MDSAASPPTVVVTHHAPSSRSIDPAEEEELIGAAYASNLDSLVAESHARFWIHGHIHRPATYWIERTCIISNPRGYPHSASESNFNPALVVDM
jgi:Icc-related predicted phosphoesterase